MNAVIYVNKSHINGCLFDAFEYYMCLKKHNPTLLIILSKIVIFQTLPFSEIIDAFLDKYNITHADLKDVYDINKLIDLSVLCVKNHIKNVLIVDEYTPQLVLDHIFISGHIYMIVEPWKETKMDYRKLVRDDKYKLYSEAYFFEEEREC